MFITFDNVNTPVLPLLGFYSIYLYLMVEIVVLFSIKALLQFIYVNGNVARFSRD